MAPLEGLSILLVEDEGIIALDESRILRGYGCSVDTAVDGESAVQRALASENLDLILMDIDLGPGMDGVEAARQILSTREIPILFLSSHHENAVVDAAEKVEAYGYVPKGVDGRVLTASIKMAIRSSQAKRDANAQRIRVEEANARLTSANDALQMSERWFRTIYEMASVGILSVDPSDGCILDCNEAYAKILGLTKEEVLGRRVAEFTHPQDREEDWLKFKNAEQTGQVFTNVKRYLRSDGAEVWVRVEAAFLPDTPERTIGVVEDISNLMQTWETQRTSLNRYRLAFDDLVEGCQILDKDLRYLYVNARAEEHSRVPRGTLVGKRMIDLYPHCEEQPLYQILTDCINRGGSKKVRNEFVYKDGQHAWFDITVRPVPEGVLVLSLDVSESVTAASKLTAESRQKDLLYHELRHRIKNSLALIGAIINLERSSIGPGQVSDALEAIDQRISVLSQLYAQLDVSNSSSVVITEYLATICGALRISFEQSGTVLTVEAEGEKHLMDMKRATSVGLIVNELVTNSFKHAVVGQGAHVVDVLIKAEASILTILISDDGNGLPENFSPETSRGLGFKLVLELVKEQGGYFDYASNGASSAGARIEAFRKSMELPECDGTCFLISIPL